MSKYEEYKDKDITQLGTYLTILLNPAQSRLIQKSGLLDKDPDFIDRMIRNTIIENEASILKEIENQLKRKECQPTEAEEYKSWIQILKQGGELFG